MTVVLSYQASFEVPIPNSVAQNPVRGPDQFNNPPTKQPRFSAGAMFATGVFLVLTPPSVVKPPVFASWQVQSHQPQHPRPERSGLIGRSQFASFSLLPMGWEVQPVQPPHPRPEKAGSILRGDDGIERPYVFVAPPIPSWAWEIQPVQPPHPLVERRGATLRGDDGTQAPFLRWFNAGWEVQPVQPPHPLVERRGAIVPKDDGNQAGLVYWRNAGWEIQSVQPPHPRRERAGAVAPKEDGNEAVFVFVPGAVPPTLGWEPVLPFTAFHLNRWSATKGKSVFAIFAPPPVWWEANQPDIRFFTTARQRAQGASGRSDFAAFSLAPFTEVQSIQPPHPRSERAGAIARGDDGNENVFTFTPGAAAPPFGYDPPPIPYRYPSQRLGAQLRGDDGIEARYIVWKNAGWEIQPWQPPHRAPEWHAGAILRGDDGSQARLINWFNAGWPVQPWQPPHPRPERAAAVLLGDAGIYAKLVFIPPPPVLMGFEAPIHVFYHRPIVGGLFAGPLNIEKPFVFVPPPPPIPPPPSPSQFRAKVFAVNCAQGNTNVPVNAETNVFNPLVVGTYVTLLVSSGNYLLPNTPSQHLLITKPDGTVSDVTFPTAFIGGVDTTTDIGTFFGGTYLVSTLYLDQPGFWAVQVVKSPVFTQVATFFVDPY